MTNTDPKPSDSETSPDQPYYNTAYVYALVLTTTLGSFFFGYVLAAFNPIQAFVQPHGFSQPLSNILITFITTVVPLGAMFGSLSSGKIASVIGRRMSLIIVDVLSVFGTALTVLPSEYSLLVGRLVQGLCAGANSGIIPLYISEIAPIEAAGSLGTLHQLLITIGVLVGPSIALGMPPGNGDEDPDSQYFRLVLGIVGILPILRLALNVVIFRYETPKYLVLKGKDNDAAHTLFKIYGPNRAERELSNLKRQNDVETRAGKLQLTDIFSEKYRFRLFLGIMISILQQLSGINAMIFFSNRIFDQGSAHGTILPTVYTVVMGSLQILATLVAGFIIEKSGRKPLLVAGMVISAILTGIFGILSLRALGQCLSSFWRNCRIRFG